MPLSRDVWVLGRSRIRALNGALFCADGVVFGLRLRIEIGKEG